MLTIDPSLLALVMGGKKDDDDEPRTVRQIFRDYTKACVTTGVLGGVLGGGGDDNGKHKRHRRAKSLAAGCVLGLLSQGLEDGSDWAFKDRGAKKPVTAEVVE